MPRLTTADIEQLLLSGKSIQWTDTNNKTVTMKLSDPKERRLLSYLLKSKIRDIKGLPADFATGIASTFSAADDPADKQVEASLQAKAGTSWKIKSVKVDGFGGVNAWKGNTFDFALDSESLLIEGPNGSGKSSLMAAIIWGLTGERPRDQDDRSPNEARPVFGSDDKEIGSWPPVATYPAKSQELKHPPVVSVEITFSDAAGRLATVKRSFDGKNTTVNQSPDLQIPSILLEAGLLMPARLPQLRLDEGRGRLTDAVQKLTGLDDLINLGLFVQNLCHKTRDYLSYKTTELNAAKIEFDRQISRARAALNPVAIPVPEFKPNDTADTTGPMAVLGKTLSEKASNLTKVVSGDLAEGLNLADAQVQKQIGFALTGAEQDVSAGLGALSTWKTLEHIHAVLSDTERVRLRETIKTSRQALDKSVDFYEKEKADSRFRLKALGAQWHAEHDGDGSVENCPLCTRSLQDKPELKKELNELKSAGEAATRRLTDNVNAIFVKLESAVPPPLKRYLSDSLVKTPRTALLSEIQAKYVFADRYTKYLTKFAALVKAACANAPSVEFGTSSEAETHNPEIAPTVLRISKIEEMCLLSGWFEHVEELWQVWWQSLAVSEELPEGTVSESEPESLRSHLTRLDKALGESEPYRVAADAMQAALKDGKIAAEIEKEREQREKISLALTPLKQLSNLAEAQARVAIDELSDRIGQIHEATYLATSLRYQKATLEKKTGLVVRGEFSDEVRIDATLVANTSWLRGVLWAFIFALREEAVEQLGGESFPILVLDDPQQTFDSEHRHRWAEHIARLQKGSPGVQLLLATHDELFLSFLEIDGVSGRHALICAAGPELGHIGLFEGDELDRRWITVQKSKTPAAARDFMASVRVFVEGMLKLMLRAEDIDVSGSVIGGCREKIHNLHKAGLEPWNRNALAVLSGALGKGIREIKFIEIVHHAAGANFGMTEAVDVERYWRNKLRPALERAFRIVRDHRALHGGLTALHAMTPTADLPEGYKAIIRAIQLPLVGTAAALTEGRVADGCLDFTLEDIAREIIELKDHAVYRLNTPTLEPVAKPGDLLLVSEHTTPGARSLVVARNDDRLLARRLEIADNHSDVAVLTANAINPRMIAPPIVAKLSTLSLQKIVGVVFDHGKSVTASYGSMEICDCQGEANVKKIFADMRGLVEVVGHSAEPAALDKQFLLIGKPLALADADQNLEGHPVIAEDSTGSRYFKRYRGNDSIVILESMEIGGNFAPIALARTEGSAAYLTAIWPVLGVLFERPR